MSIENGKVVTIHYTLTSDEGETLDTSVGGDPLAYLHGANNIVPGLEAALAGRAIGDTVETRVSPEQGYGPRVGEPEAVPRVAFPEDVELAPGMLFNAETPDGRVVSFQIDRIEDETVYVDHNHPLAGAHLNFSVEVVGIRDASAEEQAHGHPHGPGDPHH
ncbi:MAG TPA: peptidylprolyl isomerase [Deltaproteobacteria bacterium]|nr:peptidylprolyl isomerase [Deltaproteobacteria bacterium]